MLMATLRKAEGEHWVITHNLQSLSTGNEQDSLRQPIITPSAYSHYSAEAVVHSHKDVQRWKNTIFCILAHVVSNVSWCRIDLIKVRIIGREVEDKNVQECFTLHAQFLLVQ